MEPSHPPYLPSSTSIPRTLIRWLDVNAQNGALTRVSTYLTIPPFNIANSWNGYSNIVASFNFESPNNVSLVGIVFVDMADASVVIDDTNQYVFGLADGTGAFGNVDGSLLGTV
jgi:hypothetical protein